MAGGMGMAAHLDRGLPEEGAEAGRRGAAWLAVPFLLAAGWGAFLAYSAVFLTEDVPLRPAAAEREAPALDFPDPGPNAMQAARRVAYGLDEPARERAREAAAGAHKVAVAPPAEVRTVPEPAAAPLAGHPVPLLLQERADHVGVWGPNAAACGAPHRRRGYYQATITNERARAGRTTCSFHDGRRVGNAWVAGAECADRGRRWSSQVRLVVDGDRLTWTSAKGSATYVRCSRRAG